MKMQKCQPPACSGTRVSRQGARPARAGGYTGDLAPGTQPPFPPSSPSLPTAHPRQSLQLSAPQELTKTTVADADAKASRSVEEDEGADWGQSSSFPSALGAPVWVRGSPNSNTPGASPPMLQLSESPHGEQPEPPPPLFCPVLMPEARAMQGRGQEGTGSW